MSRNRAHKKPVPPMKQGTLSVEEMLEKYGDMSLAEFTDEAIKYGLIPLNFSFLPIDELALHPQVYAQTNMLTAQNGLAA